jgi:hypothetical protein
MEKEQHEQQNQNILFRLPIIGAMGKRAIGFFGSQMDSQALWRSLLMQRERRLAEEEEALKVVQPIAGPTSIQGIGNAYAIAQLAGERLAIHAQLDDEHVGESLNDFMFVYQQLPEGFNLEDLALPFDATEAIRIRMKELEGQRIQQ